MKKSTWSLLLILAMAGWAAFYPFTKLIQGAMDPLLVAFFRYFFASLVLIPLNVAFGKLRMPEKRDWLPLIAIAALAVLPTTLTVIGIKLSSSIVGSILVNTNPLFVAAFAPFLIGEHVTRRKLSAMALGFAGIVVTILNGQSLQSLFQSSYFIGALFLLGTALCSALFSIGIKRYIRKYGGLVMTLLTVGPGSILLAVIIGIQGGFTVLPSLPPSAWLFGMLNGILATAVPYAVWNSSVKHLDVTTAVSFKLLIPVFATVYSLIFLQEDLTIWMIIGMILAGVGVYLVQRQEEPAMLTSEVQSTS